MEKTYLELLAENDAEARKEFEPNAKDLLTANFVEYDDQIGGHDAHPDELEDQHEFQKPQGSHQLASLMPEAQKDIHKTQVDIRYSKDTQIHVISIDSRFRTDQGANPSNFIFKLLTPIKNVISIRLSSLEIPNTWYTFSEIRGNTSMLVFIQPPGILPSTITGRMVITEGNYSLNTGDTNDILIEVFTQLNNTFPTNSFSVKFNPINGKLTISCFTKKNLPVNSAGNRIPYSYENQPLSNVIYNPDGSVSPIKNTAPGYETPVNFSMNFADGIYSTREDNWGLGYNLGYRIQQTEFSTFHTAESITDVVDSNYIFLSLNPDWRVVEHTQPDSSQTAAFAKVIIDVPKNDIVYDNGANTITKQYFLKQPGNISSFNISIVDEYEQYIQLEGGNISLTLEVTEVLHASLYDAMRV
jgi:hypothetical protein